MSDLEARLEDLERRLRAAEDRLAIHDLIVRYGLAVDIGDAQGVASVFEPDAEFDVGGGSAWRGSQSVVYRGRGQIMQQLVQGEGHQSMLPDCAHTIGPVVIEVEGDRALATGYSRIYHRKGKHTPQDHIDLFRIGFNRWELARQPDESWLIARRMSRALGDLEAHELFARALG